MTEVEMGKGSKQQKNKGNGKNTEKKPKKPGWNKRGQPAGERPRAPKDKGSGSASSGSGGEESG